MAEPITEGWISVTDASMAVGYTSTYVRILAQQKRIEARKVGRDWLVSLTSLVAYKAEMDRLGTAKHNPWRDDLVTSGRGRTE